MENNNFEAQQTPSVNTPVEAPKKNKTLPIFIILAVVLCLCLVGFYLYSNSPKQILANVLNKTYAKYDTFVNQDLTFDIAQDSIKFEDDLNLDTNIEGFEKLKEDVIAIAGGIDYKNKKVEGAITLKEGSTKLVELMTYIIENRLYMTLGDDYKGLIDAGEFDSAELFNLDADTKTDFDKNDINYVVRAYKDIIINSIDEKALVKGETTITIDGKETKVSKLTYDLNNENLDNFYKNIITKTLENKELIKTLAKLTNTDESKLTDALKDAKGNTKAIANEKIVLEIYTNGFMNNNFVGFNFNIENGLTVNYIKNQNNTKITLSIGKEVALNLTINENTNKKFSADYEIKYGETNISGNLTTTAEEMSKNKYKGSISFTVKYDKYSASIKSNYSLEVGSKIADIDTTKAIDAENASNDLYNAINNISSRLSTSNIGSIINSLSGYSTDYDYE